MLPVVFAYRHLPPPPNTLLAVPMCAAPKDSMFMKRPCDGATRWHSDLHMAPLDTNDMVTAWVPLGPVPAQVQGLFNARSACIFKPGKLSLVGALDQRTWMG